MYSCNTMSAWTRVHNNTLIQLHTHYCTSHNSCHLTHTHTYIHTCAHTHAHTCTIDHVSRPDWATQLAASLYTYCTNMNTHTLASTHARAYINAVVTHRHTMRLVTVCLFQSSSLGVSHCPVTRDVQRVAIFVRACAHRNKPRGSRA